MPEHPAALLLPADAFDTDSHQVMGRRVAGRAMAEGLAAQLQTGERLTVVGFHQAELQQLAALLQPQLPAGAELALCTGLGPGQLREWGCLHLPDPGLGQWCQLRSGSPADAFSLSGVIHTLCSNRVLLALEQLLDAPVYPWDALICTSSAGKRVVEAAMAARHEQLQQRFGMALPKPAGPELPVIPLAIDPAPYRWEGRFASRGEQRLAARQQLGLAVSDFVVLFVGRLSFHSKAHPELLYRALDQLSQDAMNSGRQPLLLECGHIFNESIAAALAELQQRYPHVRVMRLGGLDPASDAEKQQALAAADVFCSLADNLQETFGLSLLEAMAAELPVIASDWNGYRDLIADGQTGMLIPTADSLADEPGIDALERRYRLGFVDYDTMVGLRSLAVAVAEPPLRRSLQQLLEKPQLAQRLGYAGRQRLEQRFCWPVVAGQYRQLWRELAQRRAHSQARGGAPITNPTASYSALFGHYASQALPAGPFQIRNDTASIRPILLSSMQGNFLRLWCGAALEALVDSLEQQPNRRWIDREELWRSWEPLGIPTEHRLSLQAALLKLGILQAEGW
jgi:starch synthase